MEIKRLIVGMVQTNCYIAVHPETKEAVIVDPGDEAARIEDALAQTGAKAKAILLTHGHFDHVTAMEELRRDLGVPVYACEQEQAVLADPDKNLSVQFQGGGLHLKADMLLKDGETFEAAGYTFQMLHTPGHTPGGCCYYMEQEGVLFSGDTLFHGSRGRTDFPGGSESEIMKSIREKLLKKLPDETAVLPGHNDSTTIGTEKVYY